jgi:hypothetical protein
VAWKEWEQLKAAAAKQGSGRTRIDHTAAGPVLKASQGPWTRASGAAMDLRTGTNAGLTELRTAHEGVTRGTDGFASTAALDEILATWEKRLTSVRDECDRLHGALARAGRDFGEVDPAVAARVNRVNVGSRPDWAR